MVRQLFRKRWHDELGTEVLFASRAMHNPPGQRGQPPLLSSSLLLSFPSYPLRRPRLSTSSEAPGVLLLSQMPDFTWVRGSTLAIQESNEENDDDNMKNDSVFHWFREGDWEQERAIAEKVELSETQFALITRADSFHRGRVFSFEVDTLTMAHTAPARPPPRSRYCTKCQTQS